MDDFEDGSHDEESFDENEEEGDSEMKTDTEDADDQEDEFDMDVESKRGDNQEYMGLPVQEQLAKWHANQRPLEVDLITELDGSNLFFVNAESLIVDLILTKQVAFEEDVQFLRLIFAIEQQLDALKACDGIFRLVFFDGLKKLMTSAWSESVWAFRQAFLMHCRSMGIDYAVFPHWYSDEYKAHVVQWRPSFTLVANQDIELTDEDEDEDEDEEEKQAKLVKNVLLGHTFHALMLNSLSMKQHVAILHGMQRRGNRVMVFALEPECYNVMVDRGVQAAILPLLSGKDDDDEEEEEEEEEEEGVTTEEFCIFAKEAVKKVKSDAVLRSFLAVRFTKDTLEKCEGVNAQTQQLMKLVVKALIIQELMLQQIPLDKRATAIHDADDWELWDNITAALDNYFSQVAEDLSSLLKQEAPEGVSSASLDTCDLFDGRLYRFIFNVVTKKGLESSGQIGADFFGFQPWLTEAINFLWQQAGGANDFFPIDTSSLAELPGIEPPEMPEKEEKRAQPVLQEFQNEYLEALWKGTGFKNIKETDSELKEPGGALFGAPCNWTRGARLDSLKAEETMEENEAAKKFRLKREQRIKEGKKVTAKDLEFEKQFQLNRRQKALRQLHLYSKSLTGSDKLHPAIIMKEDKGDKEEEENGKPGKKKGEKEEKISKKHVELLEKRKIEEEAKIKEFDKEKSKQLEPKADALAEVTSMEKFESELLDLLLGFGRITDSMVGFPAISGAFKTNEAQAKLIVKVVKSCRTAFKKMAFELQPENIQPQIRTLVKHFYCLLQEAYRSYGKELDGKSIKLFQECLISIGFPKSASYMFDKWKDYQNSLQAAATEAEAAPEKDKGGKEAKGKDAKKDDKKDKKDDKKKDKDDKKDKKDDKKSKKSGKEEEDDKADKDPENFRVTKQVEVLWSGVGSDELVFQLQFMGPYMTRTVGTAKDPLNRVMFKPDEWQRRLLDIVDANKSALVSAPTASGKTFIGYYVMDKVLRMDNESVAVYVAPSKALVNQVSAEIYARFSSKTYPAHSKNELLGVFLREYNSAGGDMVQGKWKMCQVLVTVPHILEALLLSAQSQDWVKRLKYVIFDEVHCIGEQEGGSQWEHSMQTIPCPFIALSATVADPSFFHGWLNKINKRKNLAEVEFVCHTERWNDLYKYMFADGMLRPLHPFCSLVEQSVKKNGLASDLSLTPQEMVQLWLEVRKQIPENPDWERLAPVQYFANGVGFMSKKDARQFEANLKETFLQILKDGKLTSEGFQAMSQGLQKAVSGVMAANSTPSSLEFSPPPRDGSSEAQPKAAELSDLTEIKRSSGYLQGASIVRLCRSLDEKQYLPGIIFNFSKKDIDVMLRRTVKELKDRQYDKYYGDEDKTFKSKKIMERRWKEYNDKKTAYEQAVKALASKNQEAKAARKGADDGEGKNAVSKESIDVSADAQMAEPVEPTDLSEDIDMEFSFHSPKALGQWSEEIQEMFQQLKYKGTFKGKNAVLFEGLQRGIGMHHEACKTAYKQAVEVLFRRGYLRVIFATKTLALGINMPCRATVFCGDSLELNGLMYRQMSGRAGRRGFDLMGQVVFWDMSFQKVRRLISSDLSKLTGEFVLSPTSLLRVLMCWEQTCDIGLMSEDKTLLRSKEDIARTLAPMFSMPFFQAVGADLDVQAAYHTRFSTEFLMREGLIDSAGNTRNLANLVTHLFEVEPANFLLSRLLSCGLLHKYLEREAKKMKKGERRTHLTVKLTEILGWLLYRVRLPDGFPAAASRKKHLPSQGCPRLDPLPDDMLQVVKMYNASVFELFQQLAWTAASAKKFGADDFTLPFSKRAFEQTWDKRGEPLVDSDFLNVYIKQKLMYRARSPMAAITGSGDRFSSPYDLVSSLRNAVLLDLNSLPMLLPAAGPAGAAGELEATNSWAVDFMIHGKIKYLWEDNGIDATKAYALIMDFKEKVKMAVDCMKVFTQPDDIVLKCMQLLAAEMHERLGGEKGR